MTKKKNEEIETAAKMNIEIGNHFITADARNFIVSEKYEKRDKFGNQGITTGVFAFREISYHPTIESALRKILTRDMRSESVQDIDSLLETIYKHRGELETIYTRLKNVLQVTV